MQRRSSVSIFCLNVSVMLQQSLCHCIISQICCQMQRRFPVSVICIDIVLVLEQKNFDQYFMSFDGCDVQGRLSVFIPSFDVDPADHQQLHHLVVSTKTTINPGWYAVVVPCYIHLTLLFLDPHPPYSLVVEVVDNDMQCCVPVPIHSQTDAIRQKHFHHPHAAKI